MFGCKLLCNFLLTNLINSNNNNLNKLLNIGMWYFSVNSIEVGFKPCVMWKSLLALTMDKVSTTNFLSTAKGGNLPQGRTGVCIHVAGSQIDELSRKPIIHSLLFQFQLTVAFWKMCVGGARGGSLKGTISTVLSTTSIIFSPTLFIFNLGGRHMFLQNRVRCRCYSINPAFPCLHFSDIKHAVFRSSYASDRVPTPPISFLFFKSSAFHIYQFHCCWALKHGCGSQETDKPTNIVNSSLQLWRVSFTVSAA